MIQKLNTVGQEVLTINIGKTKIMNNTNEKYEITIEEIEIQIENVTYVEKIFTYTGDKMEPFLNKQKSEVFNSCPLPTLLYRS